MNVNFDSLALSLQFTSCVFMAGVISVIQLIHYPSFVHINRELFTRFHLQHSKALGFIAGPAMCIELISALWLVQSGTNWLRTALWFSRAIIFFVSNTST